MNKIIKDLLETYRQHLLSETELIELATSGFDGNCDDAFELGRVQGQAELAENILTTCFNQQTKEQ